MATFFADLGKKYRDLLQPRNKVFDVRGAEIAVKATTADPKTAMEASSKLGVDGGVRNKISDKLTFEKLGTAKLTLEDGKAPSVEVESKKFASDRLTVKVKAPASLDAGEVKTKIEYDPVAVSLDFNTSNKKGAKDLSVVPGFVFKHNAINVGAQAVFNDALAVESTAAGVQYAASDFVLSGRFEHSFNKNAQNVLANGIYNLNSKAQLGAQCSVDLDAQAQDSKLKNFEGSAGGRYQVASNLAVLAKVNTNLRVNAVVTHNVSPDIQLALVAQFGQDERLATGVKLTLGEY